MADPTSIYESVLAEQEKFSELSRQLDAERRTVANQLEKVDYIHHKLSVRCSAKNSKVNSDKLVCKIRFEQKCELFQSKFFPEYSRTNLFKFIDSAECFFVNTSCAIMV